MTLRESQAAHTASTQVDAGTNLVEQISIRPYTMDKIIAYFANTFPQAPATLQAEDLRFPAMEFVKSPGQAVLSKSLIPQVLLFCPSGSLPTEPKISAAGDPQGRSILLDLSTAVAEGPVLSLTPIGNQLNDSFNEFRVAVARKAAKNVVLKPRARIRLGKKNEPEEERGKIYRLMIVCMNDTIYITDMYTKDNDPRVDRDLVARRQIGQWAMGNKEQADVRVGAQLHLSQLKQHNRGRKNRKRRHNAEYLLGRPHRKPSRRQRRDQARKAGLEAD